MGTYKKIIPRTPKEGDEKSLVKSLDDARKALQEIYKKLDDLEKNKTDA